MALDVMGGGGGGGDLYGGGAEGVELEEVELVGEVEEEVRFADRQATKKVLELLCVMFWVCVLISIVLSEERLRERTYELRRCIHGVFMPLMG